MPQHVVSIWYCLCVIPTLFVCSYLIKLYTFQRKSDKYVCTCGERHFCTWFESDGVIEAPLLFLLLLLFPQIYPLQLICNGSRLWADARSGQTNVVALLPVNGAPLPLTLCRRLNSVLRRCSTSSRNTQNHHYSRFELSSSKKGKLQHFFLDRSTPALDRSRIQNRHYHGASQYGWITTKRTHARQQQPSPQPPLRCLSRGTDRWYQVTAEAITSSGGVIWRETVYVNNGAYGAVVQNGSHI